MMLVVEHVWAIGFRNAMRDSGGILIAQDFLSPEALIAVGASTGSSCFSRPLTAREDPRGEIRASAPVQAVLESPLLP